MPTGDRRECPHCHTFTAGLRGRSNICGHCRQLIDENEAVNATLAAPSADTGLQLPGFAKGRRAPRPLYATAQMLADFRAAMLEDIQQDTKLRVRVRHKIPGMIPADELHARELCLFDAHLGKYAWGEETGEDFDSQIAHDRVRAAVEDLLVMSGGFPCDLTILPIGQDLLHTDNYEGTTTAGTMQDRDTRYQLMFRRARQLMSWVISVCAERTNVQAVIVPGNHDSLSAWTLGEVLAAEYAHDPRVTFDGSPRKRKYVLYGKNLIGYAHGHNEPHKNLPQIMAAEEPEKWAASVYREWHVGHFHKSKVTQPVYVDDHQGCTVRVLRSLSGTDAWHSSMGYVNTTHGSECFMWRRSGGLRANLHHMVAA